jgi:hypothetical protein
MRNTKSKFYALSMLAVLSIIGMILASCSQSSQNEAAEVTSFDQCAAAGNPVMESSPRQCRADGHTFVEEITENQNLNENGDLGSNGKMPASFTREIDTGKGTLFLTYGNGKTLLSGSLERSTPCVSWKITAISTKDMPTSQANIKIFNENKDNGMMCAQVVAEPQEISEEISSTSENTNYEVMFEEKTLFSGKLGDE